jgi:hypothetical protein
MQCMKRTFCLALVALVWLPTVSTRAQMRGSGRALEPGPFLLLEGTRLGGSGLFERPSTLPENPPVVIRCFPLFAGPDALLAWLSAAVMSDGAVFVRRCIEDADPREGLEAGIRCGGEVLEWEKATLLGDEPALATRQLALPDWSFFSNPSFCGSSVAYWGMRGTELLVQVYDLGERRVVASRPQGEIYLVADEFDALEAPVWVADCTRVSSAARRLGSRVVEIELQ